MRAFFLCVGFVVAACSGDAFTVQSAPSDASSDALIDSSAKDAQGSDAFAVRDAMIESGSADAGLAYADPTDLATGLSSPKGIVVDPLYVYVACEGDGTIQSMSRVVTGKANAIVKNQSSPRDLFSDGTLLYWVDDTGSCSLSAVTVGGSSKKDGSSVATFGYPGSLSTCPTQTLAAGNSSIVFLSGTKLAGAYVSGVTMSGQTVASVSVASAPTALAATTTTLFYALGANLLSTPAALQSAATSISMMPGSVTSIASAGSIVYAVSGGALIAINTTTHALQTFVAAGVARVVADNGLLAYSMTNGDLIASYLDGSEPTTIAHGQGGVYGIDIESNGVFWSATTDGAVRRALRK